MYLHLEKKTNYYFIIKTLKRIIELTNYLLVN